MATVNITNFDVVRDVGNAELTLDYDIVFDDFDVATNVGYRESWKYVEADAGFDGDIDTDDDQIGFGEGLRNPVHANGRTSLTRHRHRTVVWSDLNLDNDTWMGDEEIRGEVKLEPLLPTTVEAESDVVLIDASR